MGFEIFTRKKTRTTTPSISISTSGRLGLNMAATAIMEKNAVEFVLILWDKDTNRLAVRPITKRDPRAYTLTRAKGSSMFSAKSFLQDVGYDMSETRSIPADWDDKENMLIAEVPAEHLKGTQRQPKLLRVSESVAKTGSK